MRRPTEDTSSASGDDTDLRDLDWTAASKLECARHVPGEVIRTFHSCSFKLKLPHISQHTEQPAPHSRGIPTFPFSNRPSNRETPEGRRDRKEWTKGPLHVCFQ